MAADLRRWEKAVAVVALMASCAVLVGMATAVIMFILWLVGGVR